MSARWCLCLLVLLLGSSFASPRHAEAQAWTRDQGNVYLQLSHRYIRADSFYNPNGDVNGLGQGDYVQHVLGLYSEVGVLDRWLTLSFEGELLRSNALKNQGRVLGLGDMRVGAWTGLVVKPFRLAAGVLVGVPTGDPTPTGPPGREGVAASLPTGDGEVDVHFRLALGHSFGGGDWPMLHYVLVELGYALRTEGLTDQITYRGEFGTRIDRKGWDRLLLVGRLSGTGLLGDQSFAGNGFGGIGEFAVFAWGGEVAVRVVDTMHLSFGLDGAFAGKSVPAALQYKFGVSWEL